MKPSPAKTSPRTDGKPSYSKLVKGYMGFLTGRGKSLSTLASYRGDLDLFEKFLRERKRDFYDLLPRDLESYQIWLERQGLKTNTRRRKILSARALVKYAVSRKRVTPKQEAILFLKTPDRLERLPWIPTAEEYVQVLSVVESKSLTGLRNWLVVQLLAETGLTVAELCALRWEQLGDEEITLDTGKRPRKLQISTNTDLHLREWRERNSGKHLFPGFNRHGITSEKMTPRGVELFFRKIARATGFRHLKPKTLRHYCVLEWLKAGVAEADVLKRLGVRPNYPLAPYKKALETRAK